MKIAALISIREKSTRFPKKVLKEIHNQNVTEHLIDRVKMAALPDLVIIATSDHPDDAVFIEMAENKSIEYFQGDQEDKLLRYFQVCNHFNLDGVVIIDGDDTLCFPEIIDRNVEKLKKGAEVVFWKNLPLGAASSGLSKLALEKVLELKAENDTEVWGGYFTNSGQFNVEICEMEDKLFNHPEIRMTLDYEEDYFFFKAVFDELYVTEFFFNSLQLMDLLVNKKPEICELNKSAQKKYEMNIAKATPIKFK